MHLRRYKQCYQVYTRQFAELGARLQALADEYREPSDPSLPDASLVFALFRPAPRAQAEGDAE
jgi:hypothetical protein